MASKHYTSGRISSPRVVVNISQLSRAALGQLTVSVKAEMNVGNN